MDSRPLSAYALIIPLRRPEGLPLKSMLILFLRHNHFWEERVTPDTWSHSTSPRENECPAAVSQLHLVRSGPQVGVGHPTRAMAQLLVKMGAG